MADPTHGIPRGGDEQAGGAAADERAAGVVLYRRPAAGGPPRFLLLRTARGGHYSAPKGHLDPGETFEQAALRETLEESGLRPRALDPGFRIEIAYDVQKRGRPRRKVVVYYLGEAPAGGDVTLSEEHVSARWAPIEEVRRLVAFENQRAVFEAAARRLAEPP